jgi:hypothetical protein
MPDPVVTPHQNTPQQAAQAVEGATRAQGKQAPIPGGETDAVLGPGDGSPQDPGSTDTRGAAAPAEGAERPAPTVRATHDDKRAAITARFRAERNDPEETDNIDEFARTGGLPQDFVEAAAPESAPVSSENGANDAEGTPEGTPSEDTPAAKPPTFKVKVNGKEMELSQEDLVKHAQIALASDGLLDTAKAKLKEINELQASLRAPRPAQDGHQAGQETQPAEQQPQPAAADPNQDEQIAALIEAIQFGDDPAKARDLLRNTIAGMAGAKPDQVRQEVQTALVNERMRDDGARTAKVLESFKKDHPEYATDTRAQAALERTMYDLQAEDLSAIGLDPANLVEGRPTTPADIAAAHKYYRANGMNVRAPDVLLNEAARAVSEWRGIKAPATPADPAIPEPPRGAPRIVVNRDARREAIQPQPSRSAVPQQPQLTNAQPRDRSAIVEQMKANRAGKRGQVLGI